MTYCLLSSYLLPHCFSISYIFRLCCQCPSVNVLSDALQCKRVLNRTGCLLYEYTQQQAVKWMMVSYSVCRTPPAVGIPKVTRLGLHLCDLYSSIIWLKTCSNIQSPYRGGRWILAELSLWYSNVCHYNGAQWCDQFLQFGLLDRAFILPALALYFQEPLCL